MSYVSQIYEDIKKKTELRLKFEELDKDPKLKDPNYKFYGKPLIEYGMARLSYYMCFKCK